MGLPRANKLIRATLGGVAPSVSTIKDRITYIQRQTKTCLSPADIRGRMHRACRLWSPLIAEKVKDGTLKPAEFIPVTCGSDATPVPAHPQYCPKRNIIFGLCGKVSPDHKCTLDPPAQILNGEAGFQQIVSLVRTNVWASYVYVHILQPQVPWLPPIHIHVYMTCNSYDHKPHLETMWAEIRRHFGEVMSMLPVMLTGKGADGDPKERCMFLQQMYSRWRDRHHPRLSVFSAPLPPTSSWVWLENAQGFRMRIELDAKNLIKGLFAQDPIHVVKKLDCKLDSAKVLEMGYFTCCHSHLQHVFNIDSTPEASIRRAQTGGNSSGLWRQDVFNQDRQNFMACVRRAGYKVRRALVKLQPPGRLNMRGTSPRRLKRSFLPAVNADPSTMPVVDAVFLGADDSDWGSDDPDKPEQIRTQGTVVFYVLSAAYMLIHHSQHFGIQQRMRFAGFVNKFVAHWRCWILNTSGLTLGQNFITKECYSDLVQSCHEAVFQSIVFSKYAPSLPLKLIYSGSNNCENSFSSAGGYRGMHGKRNYTCKGYTEYADNEYTMHVLQAAGVNRGRSQHSKQEWDHRAHEPRSRPEDLDRLMKEHSDNATTAVSWNAGASDATHLAEMIGLRRDVPDCGWNDPWSYMKEKLHVAEVQPVQQQPAENDNPDDNVIRRIMVPPSTFCVEDIYVCTVQVIRQRCNFLILAVNDPSVRVASLQSTTLQVISQYLFTTGDVDEVSVQNLLGVLALKRTRADRKQEKKANCKVIVPGTDTQISKEQLVELMVQEVLRCGRVDGTELSKDRISRIKATAARIKMEEEKRLEAAVDGDRAHLQDDLAFCFKDKHGKNKLWLGKLQQMRSKVGSKSRNVHNSVDLTSPPDDLLMQLQWYHETRRVPGKYVPSCSYNVDKTFVDVDACLGLAQLEYIDGRYSLVQNGQLRRFKQLMNSIN